MQAQNENTTTGSIDLTTDADTAEIVDAYQSLQSELADVKDELADVKAEQCGTQAELSQTKAELSATKSELSETKDELETVKDDRDELESEVTELRSELEETQSVAQDTHAAVEETKDDVEAVQRDIALVRSQLTATREELDDAEREILNTYNAVEKLRLDHISTKMRLQEVIDGDIEVNCTGEPDSDQDDAGARLEETIQTHLEEVVAYPEDVAEEELSSNQRRARLIARDVREYASKAPKGYVLKSGDISTVLSALDESTHPQSISRVIDFLDDFGGDDVSVSKRHGTRRIAFSEELVERLATAREGTLTTCVMTTSAGA